MRSFVFFGRLVSEKGFQLLFPFFEEILESKTGRVAVFWEGPLAGVFLERFSSRSGFFDFRSVTDDECRAKFFETPPGSVAYFGKRPFSSIQGVLEFSDISLMPSIFLETFGLSALESLSMGVPVAGFSKGGIAPFLVSEELRISNRSVTGGFVSLLSVSDKLIAEWKARAFEVSLRYSKECFRERLSSILPDSTKRILLITDFTSSIGGIETYVRNLESVLREFGFDVRIVGSPNGFSTRFQKGVSTLASFWNPVAKNELTREIADFSPDVVWCHSILRRYGSKGLDAIFDFPSFRMMTYHDLGYFAPFAAQCFEESDVPSPGFFPFIAKASGIFGKIFAMLKYLKLRMIFDRLSRFDVHLVPSDFVAPFVSAKIPGAKVVVLPHYVSFPWK